MFSTRVKRFFYSFLTLAAILSPPTSTASPLLLTDDFSDGDSSLWQTFVSGWNEADGVFHATNTGANISVEAIYQPGLSWTDYEYEADVRPLSIHFPVASGLYFRWNGPTVTPNRSYAACELLNGTPPGHSPGRYLRLIGDAVTHDQVAVLFNWSPNITYRLRATAVGNVLTCEVMGEPGTFLTTTSSLVEPSGTVGLRSTHIRSDFDNVVVRALASSATAWAADDRDNRDTQVFNFDLEAGDLSLAGPVHPLADLETLAFDATAETLFGITAETGELWEIDRTTGALSAVCTVPSVRKFREIASSSFHPISGELWAYQWNRGLVTIDLETCELTRPWNHPHAAGTIRKWDGIAWKADGSALYASQRTDLIVWDPALQTATVVCSNLPDKTEGLEYAPDGRLLGTSGSKIYEVEPSTCTVTELHDLPGREDIESLTFDTTPEAAPAGHYRFDEGSGTTALDSSGAGNHGTISGATYVPGYAGTALRFTSAATTVVLPQSLFDDFGPTSYFEAWIKPTAYPSGVCVGTIFRKRAHLNDWEVSLTSSGAVRGFQYGFNAMNQPDDAHVIGGHVALDEWSKIVMTYDGSTLDLYIDDLLVDSHTEPLTLDWALNYARTDIGNNPTDSNCDYHFIGDIDEVVISPNLP